MTNQKTKTISILDYGIGNLFSLTKAFELCGANVKMISQPSELKNVDKLLLPGVGAFAKAIWTIYHVVASSRKESSCGSACPSCSAKNEIKKAIEQKRIKSMISLDIR